MNPAVMIDSFENKCYLSQEIVSVISPFVRLTMRPHLQQVLSPACLAVLLAIPSFAQQPQTISLSCSTTTVGRIPINDLAIGLYQGYQGGLYPGGINQPPSSHLSDGLTMAAQVVPLNATGAVDIVNGRIVLLSIGMSNTTQEFSTFKSMAETSSVKNLRLIIVDGAQGGQTAAMIANPSANFWTVVNQRLSTAGVTPQQVQIAWVKEADAGPTAVFPRHAQVLDSEFVLISRNLKTFYPNIRIAYWSSRIYAGYATSNLNPEPFAYESGFAVKWTITRQINGDTALTYSGANPRSPWLAWGPYLWADGLTPRSDGLIWICDDFVTSDRTHPSTSGRLKVAQLLMNFFTTDSTAKGWFTRSSATNVDPNPIAGTPYQFSLDQNYPNPFNPSTKIGFRISEYGLVTLKVFDLLGSETATLVSEILPPGTYERTFNGANLPSGMYLYRLHAGSHTQTRKFLLLK